MIRTVCTAAVFCLSATLTLAQAPEVKPTKEHEKLHGMEGKWEVTVESEGAPASKGVATYKTVCKGLWVENTFEMNDESFSGRGLDGYDTNKKKYISIWVDSMATAPIMFVGDYDAQGKKLVMTGEGFGPDGSAVTYKSVTTHSDENHMDFTLFLVAGGSETKLMTIKYARMKG